MAGDRAQGRPGNGLEKRSGATFNGCFGPRQPAGQDRYSRPPAGGFSPAMSTSDTVSSIFITAGGLGLLLFGIQIMTAGLRAVAGERLRSTLALATRNRLAGLSLGSLLGLLIHSSAATAMTVGLVNAGLIRLAGALPILFGANIGTTLSMQVISLRLTDLAYVAIALGLLASVAAPRERIRQGGRALLGIGILFLGMDLMSGAIEPHRDAMAPWLQRIDGTTWSGMLLGILVAGAFTAIIQSSGATIGMTFVLISAGVFTEFAQIYPLVLGAHLGTSATALLASIGTSIEARRAAVGNLGFNVFNTLLALVAAPLFFRLIPLTADSLVHQTANLHTAVMAVAAVVLLPFTALYANVVEKLTPSKKPPAEGTHLDPALIPTPEDALRAALLELKRCARICRDSLARARDLLETFDKRQIRAIRMNEAVVNEIKVTFKNYLSLLTRRYLSRRQALFAKYLNHVVVDLERIGDHIENLGTLTDTMARTGQPDPSDRRLVRPLFELHEKADRVLRAVEVSLDPASGDFDDCADAILEARDDYVACSATIRNELDEKVARHEIPPAAGLYLSEYIISCDRLVRHGKMIAIEEKQPFFQFKEKKFGRVAVYLDPSDPGPPKKAPRGKEPRGA